MDSSLGVALTRVSVWLALAGYFSASILGRFGRAGEPWNGRARWLWTTGCAAMLLHVALAFGFYHQWSHAAAYRHTAEQTWQSTGLDWGGGLYFNYLLVAWWLADAAWWWRDPIAYRARTAWINVALHGFFWFMVFNATVVFETGVIRWCGLAGCGVLMMAGFIAAGQRVS